MTPQTWADGQALLPRLRPRGGQRRQDVAGALRLLRRLGLKNSMIQGLLNELMSRTGIRQMLNSWPTAEEERQALRIIIRQAPALAAALAQLSPHAWDQLQEPMQTFFGPEDGLERLQLMLMAIGEGGRRALERVPDSPTSTSHPDVIAIVASITQPLGLKLSEAPKSRFCKVCAAAFTIVGLTQSPVGSIRAFKNAQAHN